MVRFRRLVYLCPRSGWIRSAKSLPLLAPWKDQMIRSKDPTVLLTMMKMTRRTPSQPRPVTVTTMVTSDSVTVKTTAVAKARRLLIRLRPHLRSTPARSLSTVTIMMKTIRITSRIVGTAPSATNMVILLPTVIVIMRRTLTARAARVTKTRKNVICLCPLFCP